MKVYELIEILRECNCNAEVVHIVDYGDEIGHLEKEISEVFPRLKINKQRAKKVEIE